MPIPVANPTSAIIATLAPFGLPSFAPETCSLFMPVNTAAGHRTGFAMLAQLETRTGTSAAEGDGSSLALRLHRRNSTPTCVFERQITRQRRRELKSRVM